jgi:hypothetical protein
MRLVDFLDEDSPTYRHLSPGAEAGSCFQCSGDFRIHCDFVGGKHTRGDR